jgi:hypothetical protein
MDCLREYAHYAPIEIWVPTTAHDDWASQHNIAIMCRAIPHIMCSFPAIMRQTQDTFPHSCNAFPRSRLVHVLVHLRISSCIFVFSCIFTSYCTSSRFITHLHVSSCIFASYCTSSHFIVHLHISLRIFTSHCASLRLIAHLHISSCIFMFHCDLVRIIAGASIHCPASSLVHHIPFITISDYVWHHTIIISLWTLTLPHLHT